MRNLTCIPIFTPMDNKTQNKQVDELKELAKRDLSEDAKKAIEKKIKGVKKPFSK